MIRKRRKADPLIRFERLYIPEPNSGCWLWTGSLIGAGYGQFRCDGEGYAHIWSYKQFKGPIPEGLVLDHICRVPSCCNPDHVEPVTQKENLRRSPFDPARKTHCPQGHEYTPGNTYLEDGKYGDKRKCRACDRERHARRREAA